MLPLIVVLLGTMLVALLGDITLLPLLLVKFRAAGEPANGPARAPG